MEPTPSTSRKITDKAKPKNENKKKGNPKRSNSKKTFSCPGCREVYKEPITEDWIVCVACVVLYYPRNLIDLAYTTGSTRLRISHFLIIIL